tara:strand:+ start:45076 stop:45213 length:138 start_codon:yes stop_codon:yes gene_type:complete
LKASDTEFLEGVNEEDIFRKPIKWAISYLVFVAELGTEISTDTKD